MTFETWQTHTRADAGPAVLSDTDGHGYHTTRGAGSVWRLHVVATAGAMATIRAALDARTVVVPGPHYTTGPYGRRGLVDGPRVLPLLRPPYDGTTDEYTLAMLRCGLFGRIALCWRCGEWADLDTDAGMFERRPGTTAAVCGMCAPYVQLIPRRKVIIGR